MFKRLKKRFSKDKQSVMIVHQHLRDSFSRVSSDIESLKGTLSQLHVGHQLSQKDISNIHGWITHLQHNLQKSGEHSKAIQQWVTFLHDQDQKLMQTVKEQNTKLETLEKGVGNTLTTLNSKIEKISSTIKEAKTISEAVANVGNVGNILGATHATDATPKQKNVKRLTAPLQQLLAFMINSHEPMTYAQISARTGKNKTTVRVNMNRLKKRGFIEEHITPSGVKVFSIKNGEKVKKLYNIEHL